jgi:hypothetical protein
MPGGNTLCEVYQGRACARVNCLSRRRQPTTSVVKQMQARVTSLDPVCSPIRLNGAALNSIRTRRSAKP